MVRGLGLLILTVMAIGGLWILAIVAWLDDPQFEFSFIFVLIPWVVMAAIGMILLWALTALATLFRTRRARAE